MNEADKQLAAHRVSLPYTPSEVEGEGTTAASEARLDARNTEDS